MTVNVKTAIYLGWANSEVSNHVHKILAATFDLAYAHHCQFEEKIDQEALAALSADFLFSFGPLIVRKKLLDSVSWAINFHTAPPKWPGRGSCSFALFEGDTEFGVTAHLMSEEVDAGPIIRVIRFAVEPDDTVETLHVKTLQRIPELVRLVINDLAKNDWRPLLSDHKWARKALRQRDLMELMYIEESDSDEVAARKIRASSHPSKPAPYRTR